MPAPDPTATGTLQVPVSAHADTLFAGLRQHWVEATLGPPDPTTGEPEITASLASGAGLGSPYLVLQIERPGLPDVHETIDVRDFLPAWVDAALDRADQNAPR